MHFRMLVSSMSCVTLSGGVILLCNTENTKGESNTLGGRKRTFDIEDFTKAKQLGTPEESQSLFNTQSIIIRLQNWGFDNNKQDIDNYFDNSLKTKPIDTFKWRFYPSYKQTTWHAAWQPSPHEWGKWLNSELKYIGRFPDHPVRSYIFATEADQYLFIKLPIDIAKIHFWSDKPPTFTLTNDRWCIHSKDTRVLGCQANEQTVLYDHNRPL